MGEIVLNAIGDVRQWVDMSEVPTRSAAEASADVERLQAALAGIPNAVVVSAELNTTGYFDPSYGELSVPGPRVTGLPDLWDVRVEVTSPGGHVAFVVIWLPLPWNGRFLGTTGAGNSTWLGWYEQAAMRSPTIVDAVRNGFAAAMTDAGNRDERGFGWGLDRETGRIDWDLTENWAHRSTHEMAIVSKAVVEAVYGEPAAFSYLAGTSGGGRQTIAMAQLHPDDYDGFWGDCAAINWAHFLVAGLWPALVMKESGNPLPPAKLEYFRRAAIAAFDEGDGFIQASDLKRWDASQAVGHETDAGPITSLDAEVMQSIWDGPRSRAGEQLWYGPGLGAFLVDELVNTRDIDTTGVPVPFDIAPEWIGSWVLKDPDWDWTTLTYEGFDAVWERSVTEFASVDASSADLSGLRASGGKLLISHGIDDPIVPVGGSLQYYEEVKRLDPDADEMVALFLAPGDAHSFFRGPGPGITLASGMVALMEWVENGEAPESLFGVVMDPETREISMTRPICRYPAVARYVGGDRRDASSFSTEPI